MPEPYFPAESFYGQQVPFRFEADVRDCEVVGEIPACLYGGSYYRAGPDDAFPTLQGDNIINGDGRASAFHFREGGAVDFFNSGATWRTGSTPVNVSGGLESKGHPIAATGIANIWEVCHHLRGEAGDRQIEGAKVGLAHVIGLGSACGVHILERSGL